MLSIVVGDSGPRTRAENDRRAPDSRSISNDADARSWTIGANGTSLTLLIDPARDFQVLSLMSPIGEPGPSAVFRTRKLIVGGRTVPFGSRAAGFVLQNVVDRRCPDRPFGWT